MHARRCLVLSLAALTSCARLDDTLSDEPSDDSVADNAPDVDDEEVADGEVPAGEVTDGQSVAAVDTESDTLGQLDEEPFDEATDLLASAADDQAADPADPADLGTPGFEADDELAEADVATSSGDNIGLDPEPVVAAAKIPTPIKYILVIVKENHTFDNYFTGFPDADTVTHAEKYNRKTHTRTRITRPIAPDHTLKSSPNHSHRFALDAYRGGHMDGFSVNPTSTPYIRYTETALPAYWTYAKDYVLADHFFSTTLGPSSPGHEVFWFSRSTSLDNAKCHLAGGKGCGVGCTGNHLSITSFNPTTGTTKSVKPCFDLPSLPDHLPNNFTWFDYGGQMAKQIKSQEHVSEKAHFASTPTLLADIKADKLHNLMIAHVSGGAYSEHPPESPCKGENFTVDVINAAMKLPEWNEMAIVVTWDDWGGFYDHVQPTVHHAKNGAVFGNGFRLPLLVISPYARKGVVLHTRTEQASVPKLVEQLWGMKLMSTKNAHARDGVAGSLLGAFDFNQKPRAGIHMSKRTCPK